MAVLAGPKAIRFSKLITMHGSAVHDAVLVIDGDRIRSVGHDVPSNTTVIDLRPFVGLPGLIDVHVHMSYYWSRRPGTVPWGEHRPTAATAFLARENARRTLECGVTTARSLHADDGADFSIRDVVNASAMPGPRLFVAGAGLIRNRLHRPDADQTKRAALRQISAGADWLKVFGSTGSGADVTGFQTFTYEEMKAAVNVAHLHGKPVAIHSYGPSGARDAVRAGADSIEHAVDLDDDTLSEMVRRKTFYVPTVDHNRYYAEHAAEFRYGANDVRRLKEFVERNLETLRRAIRAGVLIAMGSDAVFTMFGENTHELRWFVNAGMTPEQALATATTNAAALLGVEGKLGVIAPGAFADVLAVEQDPLANIEAVVSRVRWVMKGGVVVLESDTRRTVTDGT
ncbi:MAG TPA: amidohydrolase family protein [Verrucomicrobiae bacterium]|nr:amidohydrolase family protein [Verrucomicrobiae bacterium]